MLCLWFGRKQMPFHCKYRPVAALPNPYALIGRTARKRLRAAIQYALIAFVMLIVVLWIGTEIQEYHVQAAPSTLKYYTTPKVCGITLPQNNQSMSTQTFQTKDDALESPDTFVAHCGDCGQCSTPQDVRIYDATKNALFRSTVKCAKKALVWGRKTAGTCMEESVGFTAGCNDCWIENIMCDIRECLFVCLWYGLFNQVEDGGENQQLNRCTLCDEKRCGPAFIECAGANRRRSGIVSDIERNQEVEVCRATPGPWWNNESIQEAWQMQRDIFVQMHA